jgi:WD40 repeat protein
VLWDISKSNPTAQQLNLGDDVQNRGENDFFWDVNFAPSTSILAASDSDGFITIWNLNQCQSGFQGEMKVVNSKIDQLPQQTCQQLVRWRASQRAIRKIRFTADQQWLVSAGDDGQIKAWPLNAEKIPDLTQKPKVIASLPSRVTSLDLITNDQGIWIASASEDTQVRLHRLNANAKE